MADGKNKFLAFVVNGHDQTYSGVPVEFNVPEIHEFFFIFLG